MDLKDQVFEFEGSRFRLSFKEGVREKDLTEHTLTLIREADGAPVRIAPENFMKPAHTGNSLLSPRKHYEFREVMERVIELGFSSEWIGHIGRFLSDHRLLKTEAKGDS